MSDKLSGLDGLRRAFRAITDNLSVLESAVSRSGTGTITATDLHDDMQKQLARLQGFGVLDRIDDEDEYIIAEPLVSLLMMLDSRSNYSGSAEEIDVVLNAIKKEILYFGDAVKAKSYDQVNKSRGNIKRLVSKFSGACIAVKKHFEYSLRGEFATITDPNLRLDRAKAMQADIRKVRISINSVTNGYFDEIIDTIRYEPELMALLNIKLKVRVSKMVREWLELNERFSKFMMHIEREVALHNKQMTLMQAYSELSASEIRYSEAQKDSLNVEASRRPKGKSGAYEAAEAFGRPPVDLSLRLINAKTEDAYLLNVMTETMQKSYEAHLNDQKNRELASLRQAELDALPKETIDSVEEQIHGDDLEDEDEIFEMVWNEAMGFVIDGAEVSLSELGLDSGLSLSEARDFLMYCADQIDLDQTYEHEQAMAINYAHEVVALPEERGFNGNIVITDIKLKHKEA